MQLTIYRLLRGQALTWQQLSQFVYDGMPTNQTGLGFAQPSPGLCNHAGHPFRPSLRKSVWSSRPPVQSRQTLVVISCSPFRQPSSSPSNLFQDFTWLSTYAQHAHGFAPQPGFRFLVHASSCLEYALLSQPPFWKCSRCRDTFSSLNCSRCCDTGQLLL